jgi:hypothetical protein
MRAVLFFIVFSLVPGLAYQWIQDEVRPSGVGEGAWLYLLGVAPNLLGGISLTAALIVILPSYFRLSGAKAHAVAAMIALLGLWAWEGVQAVGRMTFDVHDLLWTVPGVLIGWGGAQLILRSDLKSSC